eukprot:TRINITY_DN9651_c0_g1_i2.p1 TRINITY_DN9651_c0_g1~~TRINITY_DN9651_c0_g1_i2.p1  ORF type:complete len:385 (-),score=11.47 TRINITY_DN9651_c0_g1_i2:131-1285(-)
MEALGISNHAPTVISSSTGNGVNFQASSQTIPPTSSTAEFSRTRKEDELKMTMDNLKKKLKTKRYFKDAVTQLLPLFQNEINYTNKRLFYDALNIISFRIGKPGFDPQLALPLFDAAWEHSDSFSPGFRKNIESWRSTISQLAKDPNRTDAVSLARDDGRFGSFNTKNVGRQQASFYTTRDLLMSRLLDLHYPSYAPYDSDSDSDDEESPYYFGHPNASEPSKSVSSPFSKYVSVPFLLAPAAVKHSATPLTFSRDFSLSADIMGRTRKDGNKVFLTIHESGDLSKSAISPSSVQYAVNGQHVDLDKALRTTHGYDVTSLVKEGPNVLNIIPTGCCCVSFACCLYLRWCSRTNLQFVWSNILRWKILWRRRSRKRRFLTISRWL